MIGHVQHAQLPCKVFQVPSSRDHKAASDSASELDPESDSEDPLLDAPVDLIDLDEEAVPSSCSSRTLAIERKLQAFEVRESDAGVRPVRRKARPTATPLGPE